MNKLIVVMVIVGVIILAGTVILVNEQNEFCQKIGYEERAFIGKQLSCRKTVNDMIEAIPIYCEVGRCWKLKEGD